MNLLDKNNNQIVSGDILDNFNDGCYLFVGLTSNGNYMFRNLSNNNIGFLLEKVAKLSLEKCKKIGNIKDKNVEKLFPKAYKSFVSKDYT